MTTRLPDWLATFGVAADVSPLQPKTARKMMSPFKSAATFHRQFYSNTATRIDFRSGGLVRASSRRLLQFQECPPSSRPSPQGGGGDYCAVAFKIHATGFAGHPSAKPKTCDGDSFSPGEKARMRASVKHKSGPSLPSQNEFTRYNRLRSSPHCVATRQVRHPVSGIPANPARPPAHRDFAGDEVTRPISNPGFGQCLLTSSPTIQQFQNGQLMPREM